MRSHTPALALMMSPCSIVVPHDDPGCHLTWLKPLSSSCPHGRAALCWTMPSIMDVPHLPLASVLEFLGVTVAPLLCSSALGLTPLCSIDRLEHDLRAASLLLHANHQNCFRRLLLPGLPRIHVVQTFLQLSARLVQLVSGPFLRLQDCSVFYPGFSELAHSASFFLQTFADCWTLDHILISALAMEPDDEPFDLIAYLAELDLPETFTRAWVAVNGGTHAAAELVALAAGLLEAGVYQVHFYPYNGATDRQPRLLLDFCVFGVAGAYAVEEPWVDPMGPS